MNSFDLLRLLAAVSVVFHHTRPVLGLAPHRLGAFDYGELGVGVFFVISGYLVTASWQRSSGLWNYLRKRILRIEPALVASLVVTALVLGAIATDLPPAEYFRRPEVYLYVARNALLYPVTYDLPGVFEHNPLAHAVNGSLWTLRLEFTCYLGVAALGLAGLLRPAAAAILSAVALAVFCVLHVWRPDLAQAGVLRLASLGAQYGFLFLAGAYLQLLGRPPPPWALASALLLFTPFWIAGLPVLVVVLASLRSPKLPADISYGTYIYAFPLQQMLQQAGWLSFWASLAAVLPFALASWFLIERPALWLKGRTPRAADARLDPIGEPKIPF
jgi:peptidoglycan/LPS O-acetylase OafA/YrhL